MVYNPENRQSTYTVLSINQVRDMLKQMKAAARVRDGKVQGKYCAVWNGEVHKDSRGLYQANVWEMRQ